MRQQLNLYQPIFAERSAGLTARTLGLGLAVLVVALVGFTAHAQLRVTQLEHSVAALREEQQRQEALLAAAGEATRTAAADPAALQTRVQKLERAVQERRAALAVLESGAAGQTRGFADRLEALARRHVDGLWIDRLALSGADGAMALSGVTLDPDIVPNYLRSLSHERALSGARFDDFLIERPGAEQDAEGGAGKAPATGQLRFRAGARSLAPTAQEDAS